MTKLGVQISSVRKYLQTPQDVLESFRKVSKIGYKAIQIQWISPEVPMEFIGDALRETNLHCVGYQDFYDAVVPNIDQIMKMNDLWGGTTICVSGIHERYQSLEGLLVLSKELNELTKRSEQSGQLLLFHPRSTDYMQFGGKTAMEILLDQTDEKFQILIDVYHVIKAGLDPVSWIRMVQGRMDLIHFKDQKTLPDGTQILVPVGQGDTNWEPIFEACKQTGVQYAFAEQESWQKDAFESLEDCYKYITSKGIQ